MANRDKQHWNGSKYIQGKNCSSFSFDSRWANDEACSLFSRAPDVSQGGCAMHKHNVAPDKDSSFWKSRVSLRCIPSGQLCTGDLPADAEPEKIATSQCKLD